jgi:hypothetical protein
LTAAHAISLLPYQGRRLTVYSAIERFKLSTFVIR